jgi:DNA invertase Pin-like site-specific DNA recombinase
LDSRLGLDDALETLRTGEAEGLVVDRLDRLARDLIVQETVLRDAWALGGSVFSTSEAETSNLTNDPDDPSRALIRQVLGAVAEYERKMIALRLRAGARRKAANGGYAGGAPPFVWKAEGRSLVPIPHEQVVIERMRELRAQGRTLRAIASQLDLEGFRPRRGDRWHGRQVGRVLERQRQAAA